MISPGEFCKKWIGYEKEKFHFFSLEDLRPLKIPEADKYYLVESGAPKWAAPNIYLHAPQMLGDGGRIKIGEDRDDNPLCFDNERGVLVCVSRTNPKIETYVNQTIPIFLETLLLYQAMVEESLKMSGENAFFENKVPTILVDRFKNSIHDIDADIFKNPGSFWLKEVDRLLYSHL